ncbi:hypothetical protein RchiOBHm_Chr4g0395261 [Rosa chinensis]|uniref:Uncharacterized protein n=1 Tax=Rosa chinensis TaxID=74649 RepID=A0A2P6QRH7_ROSCH|nr:hypothetical protein RchiOBHm_Chr4g0395261 [Rosa chinensis]
MKQQNAEQVNSNPHEFPGIHGNLDGLEKVRLACMEEQTPSYNTVWRTLEKV